MKKKILIIIGIVLVVICLINVFLYYSSYHEINDYKQISLISCSNGEQYIKCDDEASIITMERKLRKINFYPSEIEYLSESPLKHIIIKYKDGTRKDIEISGKEAMYVVTSADGKIIKELSKFYYVNPLDISRLFWHL